MWKHSASRRYSTNCRCTRTHYSHILGQRGKCVLVAKRLHNDNSTSSAPPSSPSATPTIPSHDYIPGPANEMADVCYRAWHLNDSQLLAHFNRVYPQTMPWRLCTLSTPMNSSLRSALLKKPCNRESHLSMPAERICIGSFGSSFVPDTNWTHSRQPFKIQSLFSKHSLSNTKMARLPPVTKPSQLHMFRTWSAPLCRRSCCWGPRIHGSRELTEKSTSAYDVCTAVGESKTPHQHGSSRFLSQ